jgi:hypothetical protein
MLQLDRWYQKGLGGATGAVANEILRGYLMAIGQRPGPFIPGSPRVYVVATAFYLFLAFVVAIFWDDPNPVKCLAIGIGPPRIIESFARSG